MTLLKEGVQSRRPFAITSKKQKRDRILERVKDGSTQGMKKQALFTKKANRKNASPPLPLRGNGREIGRGGWMQEEIKMRKQKGVR